MTITTIGLDIAKNVFQIHAINEDGEVLLKRRLSRAEMLRFFSDLEPCIVGMEACCYAHFWARELAKFGHEIRMMPPAYVKPYVRRGKTDQIDAAAICEAAQRPHMRFVAIKSEEQQAALMLHRTRRALKRQQTRLINMIRALMGELGLVAPLGANKLGPLIAVIEAEDDESIPPLARTALRPLVDQLRAVIEAFEKIEGEIKRWHRSNALSRRLATIPGIGFITASAIAASVPDAGYFQSGREFAAWLGLTPQQNSSGDKTRIGKISKKGDKYIREMLVVGATSILYRARAGKTPAADWINALEARRAPRLVTVAIANKTARIAWAVMTSGKSYQAPVAA